MAVASKKASKKAALAAEESEFTDCLAAVDVARAEAAAVQGHVGADAVEPLDELRKRLRRAVHDQEEDEHPSVVARRLRMLVELDQERHRIRRDAIRTGAEDLVRIHRSIARLRELGTPEELVEGAPRELCQSCGFTRAMISLVHGSIWNPQTLEVLDGVDPEADRFREYIEGVEIPLSHLLLETELVRRRIPGLITDPANDPRTFKEIVEISRSPSYVATPIMPTGRVSGFLHADRFGQDTPCGPEDRDNIWTFAEHFGLLYERTVLADRLEVQRRKLKEALEKASTTVDEVYDAEIDLDRHDLQPEGMSPRRRGGQRPSRVDALLTRREREVLELMVSGATNTLVAQQLVVSEGTVKSHVKRILRKLHAANRAEAVARYLQLMREESARR